MKSRSNAHPWLLLLLACMTAASLHAAAGVGAQLKFKDLPVNTEFYFASDTSKHFLKLKVSETVARTVASGEELGPVPANSLVVKKDGATTPPAKKLTP
jgi:hypothetical protein